MTKNTFEKYTFRQCAFGEVMPPHYSDQMSQSLGSLLINGCSPSETDSLVVLSYFPGLTSISSNSTAGK